MEQTYHALMQRRRRWSHKVPRVTMARVSCRNIKRRAPSTEHRAPNAAHREPVYPLTQRLINTSFNKYCFNKINIELVIRRSCCKTHRIDLDFTSL